MLKNTGRQLVEAEGPVAAQGLTEEEDVYGNHKKTRKQENTSMEKIIAYLNAIHELQECFEPKVEELTSERQECFKQKTKELKFQLEECLKQKAEELTSELQECFKQKAEELTSELQEWLREEACELIFKEEKCFKKTEELKSQLEQHLKKKTKELNFQLEEWLKQKTQKLIWKYEEFLKQKTDELKSELQECLKRKNDALRSQYEECLGQKDRLKHQCVELQDENGVITAEKDKLQEMYEELEIKYDECSESRDRLSHQIKQVTQSESSLQMKYARLIKANEELINEKAYLENIVKTMEGHAKTDRSLEEKITSQESCLLEKTQRILTLEASLSCATETTKKTDEIWARLKPLQAIPGILSSRCEGLSLQIADTTEKLDRVANSNSQLVDKMNTLVKAWESFRGHDTSDEAATNTAGGENIPAHLKPHVQHLCNTVGPNWLDVGRALDLDGDQLQRIWADWGEYGMRELTVRVIECWCANSPESSLSLDVLKTAMGRVEINPLIVEPMCDDDRKRLRENYQLLVDDMMDVTHIEGYLRQAGILSGAALDYVIYPNTSRKRIQRLLKILPFSGDRALPEFKGALMESGQTHLSSALAGEQCSASQTDRNILVERLVANTNNDLNTSDCTLVKGLQDETCDDRKLLESILDGRLEVKKIDDREMFQRILVELLDAKRVDDRKIFENVLDERLEAKKRTDCEMFRRILVEFLEAKKNDDQTIFERILEEGHAIKRGDDRKVLEKIDELLKPSVRASAEIKQIIYMLYEKWDSSMFLSAEWHETEL